MERFDLSPIKINHLAFKLSKSGAPGVRQFEGQVIDLYGVMLRI
jgi:hypothetical protein